MSVREGKMPWGGRGPAGARPVDPSLNDSASLPEGNVHSTFIGKPFSTILYGLND